MESFFRLEAIYCGGLPFGTKDISDSKAEGEVNERQMESMMKLHSPIFMKKFLPTSQYTLNGIKGRTITILI